MTLEIYNNGKLIKKLQRFLLTREGSFFLFLRGINICEDGMGIFVDELLIPLITIKRQGHLVFIDIAKRDGNFLTIVLFNRFPFVYIGSGNAEFEEDEVR